MSIETPRNMHLSSIQALRGFAALLVVLSHIYAMERNHSPDQLLSGWANYGAIGVDLFFVISGFIMVHVTRDVPSGAASAGHFLLRRAGRIYPLYWGVTLALLLVWFYRPDLVFSSIAREPDLIASFTLWPHYRPPLLAIGWTLTFEIMFYIIFAVSLLMPRKFLGLFLSLWAILIVMTQVPLWNVWIAPRPLPALLAAPIVLEFILGAALALLLNRISVTKAQGARLLIIGLISGGFAATILSVNGENILNNFAVRTAIFAGPAGLIIFGAAAMDINDVRVPKILETLGDWSYSIYLTHILTLGVMAFVWTRFAVAGPLDNILMIIAFFMGSIAVGGLTYHLIERPLMRGVKRILPARPK